jgi:predicted Zn-dependent protease with MMP-like domain
MELGREDFEALVEQALDEIPDEIAELVHNVVVLVEDDPPPPEPGLLGVYEGVALTVRGADHTGLPDRITIFRRPLLRMSRDAEELVREVRITVVHEVAHHFGIDDDRLHELGYG